MMSTGRVWVIYRKELLEILRDRRTLLAMIVIPVVLYPALMLGFVRAAESEQVRLRSQKFIIETSDEDNAALLREMIDTVRPDPASTQAGDAAAPDGRPRFEVRVGNTPPHAWQDQVHLQAVVTVQMPHRLHLPPHFDVQLIYNEVDINSRTAMEQFSQILRDFAGRLTRESLARMIAPDPRTGGGPAGVDALLNPLNINTVSTATEEQRGGWALGQIVPIILVLMTITAAVYPAIDLTAGERERGTLEALMATPVPVLHLIAGKFLTVATIGLIAATLNAACVGATMHFGGLTQAITTEMPIEFPVFALPIIFVCMIPFALLFSAILIAVASFARTFKEAQNYVMPVIICALIPAVAVTLPSTRLQGVLMVLPVGNMVLLTREVFQQTFTWTQVAVVLLSTSLYAAAAVAVAARLFGQEAVLFVDSGSYKTLFQRRYFRPRSAPSASQALLVAALLFPGCFYLQSLLQVAGGGFVSMLAWLAVIQFAGLFVLAPLGLALFLKLNPRETFRLRWPPLRCWLAVLMMAAASWALAQEFFTLQSRVMPPSEALQKAGQLIGQELSGVSPWLIVLLLGVIPGLTEEFLFRGFLLSGLSTGLRKWPAILLAALIFGGFHFILDRVPVTFLLGALLGYVCWQSRSLLPGILFHILHNSLAVLIGTSETLQGWLRLPPEALQEASTPAHLPAHILIPAAVLFITGLALIASLRPARGPAASPVMVVEPNP